ncbi:unnamed protein product [Protopolystoma xenopodis]|uniref:Uncharacterized protein n=1 Tax=Protopolystoma xenopodis TaxID=117903 RepID=A0A3S5CRZ0_9PLAT|nr:unnamed protein product [Protopolystoma xenopodis]
MEASFWMPLDAVTRLFSGSYICFLPSTNIFMASLTPSGMPQRAWRLTQHHSSWYGELSGGDLSYRQSFLKNPQT